MFAVASDLSEIQRERLTSTRSLRGMTVPAYTLHEVKTVFMDFFPYGEKFDGKPFTTTK